MGSCGSGERCSWYARYRQVGASSWTSVPSGPRGPVNGPVSNVPLSESISGLGSGVQYEYQVCGNSQPAQTFVCVGPDGGGSTTQKFVTATATTCNPAMNPAGTPASGTVVAPGLRVISTQWGLGNCPSPFFVSARAADGTIWATDYSNHIWKSTDDMRTLQLAYTAAGYVQVEQVLPLSSGTVLIVVRDANGVRHVLRSTDSTGTWFASTPVLDLPVGGDAARQRVVGSAGQRDLYRSVPRLGLRSTCGSRPTTVERSRWCGRARICARSTPCRLDPYQPGADLDADRQRELP